jgi:hypothetical protein
MRRTSSSLAAALVLGLALAAGCSSDPQLRAGIRTCGHAGEACCEQDACDAKLRCIGGSCAVPPSDIGLSCTTDAECFEGACVRMASAEGGEHKICSRPCTTVDECVKGWQCTRLEPGRAACTCAQSTEVCDGKDNDCNGVVDDGTADALCSSAGAGQQACHAGRCACVTECGDPVDGATRCVDARSDVENCGGCGKHCTGAEICGNGKCICPSGTLCDGVCADTQNDNRNCGGCGKVCEFQCRAGECGPSTVVARDPNLLGALGSNVHRSPRDLALDDTRVYFVYSKPGELLYTDRPEQIRACPLTGCTKAPDEVIPFQQRSFVTNLLMDGPTLYWQLSRTYYAGTSTMAENAIMACTAASCATTTRAVFDNVYDVNKGSAQFFENPIDFTVSGGAVYWTSRRGIRSCPATGCTSTPTALTTTWLEKIAVDAQGIYAAAPVFDGGLSTAKTTIVACALDGCTNPTPLTDEPGEIRALIAYGGRIYWTANVTSPISTAKSRVASCVPATCASTLVVLADGDKGDSLAVDAQGIYWTRDEVPLGSVRKCLQPSCAGGPTTVADHQHGPGAIVVNATSTFWADRDFQLFRFGK